MDQYTYIMSEIARLRIENAELRKNLLVKQNLMKGEPSHYHSKSVMSDQGVQTMFSDNQGFEQFSGPDYGSDTRAERAGFMSMAGETETSDR